MAARKTVRVCVIAISLYALGLHSLAKADIQTRTGIVVLKGKSLPVRVQFDDTVLLAKQDLIFVGESTFEVAGMSINPVEELSGVTSDNSKTANVYMGDNFQGFLKNDLPALHANYWYNNGGEINVKNCANANSWVEVADFKGSDGLLGNCLTLN